MSKLVDKRIVEMDFDNSRFEAGVKQSMSTIDKLKSNLDFSGISNSLNKSFGSVDTSVLSGAVGTVTNKFSTMEIVAISAISNITNRVINLGIQMVKSLSIDNVAAGWSKYEENVKSVGTLLSQDGNTIEGVNTALSKLMWFTDQTSYSYTDMVSNISKFTAAGQNLEDSVQAMMGIANWAALSGQNASVASRAMYQLSQAMGQGVIKLQDWKSIQNANMDTQEFRQQVLDTAVAMGYLNKTIDGNYLTTEKAAKAGLSFSKNQFTTTLSDGGWFTSDVLMATLSKYSSAVDQLYSDVNDPDKNLSTAAEAIEAYEQSIKESGDKTAEFGLKAFRAAQEARTFTDAINATKDAVSSGWLSTFDKIFGSYDEAKKLWTDLADELWEVFASGGEKRNQILTAWKDLGGRDDIFANDEETTGAFWNLFYAITSITNAIKEAWHDIFNFGETVEDAGNNIKSLTSRFKYFTAKLRLSEDSLNNLKNIFKGGFSILKAFVKILKSVFKGFKPLIDLITKNAGSVLKFIGDFGAKTANLISTTTIFDTISMSIANFLNTLLSFVKSLNVIENFKIKAKDLFEIFKTFGGTTDNFSKILSGLKAALEIVLRFLLALYDPVKEYLLPIFKRLTNTLSNLMAKYGGVLVKLLAYVGDCIVRFNEYTKVNKTFQNGIAKIVDFIKTIPSRLSGLIPFFEKIKYILLSIWNVIKKIPSAISSFVQQVTGKSVGEVFHTLAEKIKSAVSMIGKAIGEFANIDTSGIKKFDKETTNRLSPLTSLFTGIKKLFEGLWSVLKAVAPIFGQLLGLIGDALKYFGNILTSTFTGKDSLFTIKELLSGAFWAGIIYYANYLLTAFASWSKAFKEVVEGVASVLDSKAMMQYAEALKTFAIGILLIVASLILLASIEAEKLTKALAVIGIILVGIMGIMKALSSMFSVSGGSFKDVIKNIATMSSSARAMQSAATAMLAIAGAALLLTFSVKLLSELDRDKSITGLMTLTIILAELVVVSRLISQQEKSMKKGIKGMISLSVAVLLLSVSLSKIAKMDMDSIKRGLIGLSGIVALCIIFAKASSDTKKALTTATSMIIFATAMIIASVALKRLSSLSWEDIGKGVTGLLVVAAIMASLGALSKYMSRAIFVASSMVVMGVAFIEMALAMKILGSMSWDSIKRACVSLAAIAAVMSGIGFLSKFMKKSLIAATSMLIIGSSFIEMALAMKILGSMSWKSLIKAAVALAGITAIMAGISKIFGLKSSIVLISFGASLIILSAGLTTLAISLGILGRLSLITIGKGLLTLVAAFAVLGISAAILSKFTPTILGLALAFGVFGIGALALSVGLSLLVASISVLGNVLMSALIDICDALIAAGPKIAKGLEVMLDSLFKALIGTVDRVFELADTLLENLLKLLITRGPDIINTVLVLLVTLLDKLKEYSPTICEDLISMLMSLLAALRDNISGVVDIVLDVVVGIIEALTNKLPEILETLGNIVVSLIDGLVQMIVNLIPRLVTAAFNLVIGLIDGLGQAIEDNAGRIKEAMINFGNHLINAFRKLFGINSPSTLFKEFGEFIVQGLINGIEECISKVVDVIKKLWQTVTSAVSSWFNNALSWGKKVMTNIGNGMKSMYSNVKSSLTNWWNGVTDWFNGTWNTMKSTGSHLMEGLKSGITNAWDSVKNGVTSIGKNISNWWCNLWGIHSPSRVFAGYGEYMMLGLADGLEGSVSFVDNSIDKVGNQTTKSMSTVIKKISSLLDNGMDDRLTIRPVMDLTDIQNGTNQIYGMFDDVNNYSISGSNALAERVARGMSKKNYEPKTVDSKVSMQTNDSLRTSGDIINTFNITGDNPKAIAEEVSKIIQKQIDRRHAKWATR